MAKKRKKKKCKKKSLKRRKPRTAGLFTSWDADDYFDPKKVVQKICDYLKKAKSLYDINERLGTVHWGGIQDLIWDGTGMLSSGTRFSKTKQKLRKKKAKKKAKKKKRIRRRSKKKSK